MLNLITLSDLQALEARLMSELSSKLAEVKQDMNDAVARVQGDVAALTAKLAALQLLVDTQLATPADMATIEELRQQILALDPTKPDVLPPAPPPVPSTDPLIP